MSRRRPDAMDSATATAVRQRRPSEEAARTAIEAYLDHAAPGWDVHGYKLIPDGDETSASNKCGWAFWIFEDDTTSYVHENLHIEWYGTAFDPENYDPEAQ